MKTSIRPEQAGIPKGGATNEVLKKTSSGDYATTWGPQSGGGSGFSGGYNVLPIGKIDNRQTSGQPEYGQAFVNNIFTDGATNRLYAMFNQTGLGNDTNPNVLRIFKNDFGSYYVENEVYITRSMLTNTTVGNAINGNLTWTTDNSYIYAVISYTKQTGSVASYFSRIDVIRFDLDGTNPIATNIYAVTGAPSVNRDDLIWRGAINGFCQAGTIVGTSLFLTYSAWNGSAYVDYVKEYTISGTTYTLINTYTRSGNSGTNEGHNMQYDATTNKFYISGIDSNSGVPTIGVWSISGGNFLFGSLKTYTEIGYGNNRTGSILNNFNISSVIDNVTYNTIYAVQEMSGTTGGSPAFVSATTYWLMLYNFPKF